MPLTEDVYLIPLPVRGLSLRHVVHGELAVVKRFLRFLAETFIEKFCRLQHRQTSRRFFYFVVGTFKKTDCCDGPGRLLDRLFCTLRCRLSLRRGDATVCNLGEDDFPSFWEGLSLRHVNAGFLNHRISRISLPFWKGFH